MTVATMTPQAQLDEEDAALFRGQVRKQADQVRHALKVESTLRAKLKECRTELKFANRRLMSATEETAATPPNEWMAVVGKSLRRVETAREGELRIRQEWDRARFVRRQAQEELQVRVRKQFDYYPLFDARPSVKPAETPAVPTCRVCGCTETDCSGCVAKTGNPCYWVEVDLCSVCQDQPAAAWRGTPVGAMGLPQTTVNQLHHWGLTTAGAVAVVLDAGGHIAGLNTEAHAEILDSLARLSKPSPQIETKKRGRKKKEG